MDAGHTIESCSWMNMVYEFMWSQSNRDPQIKRSYDMILLIHPWYNSGTAYSFSPSTLQLSHEKDDTGNYSL